MRSPIIPHLKAILAIVIVFNSFLNLRLCVHHKRAILCHRLIEWLSSNEHKPQRLWRAVPHTEAITTLSEDKDMVCCSWGWIWRPKNPFPFDHISKGIPRCWNALMQLGSGHHGEIKEHGWSAGVDWGLNSHCFSCYHSHFNPIFFCCWYVLTWKFLIVRLNPDSLSKLKMSGSGPAE